MPDEIVENHPTAAQRRWANNAALIVRAANSFDALKSALEKCENVIGMARLQGKLSDNALSPVNNALISAHAALDAVRK
jgi:tRNA C32,U32 (ribose-2'-O)-methylase TrmJ